MKNIAVQKLVFLPLVLLFYCQWLSAQQQDEVVIIKKMSTEDAVAAKGPRPILGIYTDETGGVQGIKIKSVIAGKGAEAAGIQDGDVITLVDGQTVALTGDLHTILTGKKPGEKVEVRYLRSGDTKKTIVELSAANDHFEWQEPTFHRDPCKVFIGVGTSSVSGGLKVDYTVDNTPATQYGVQAGDIILALDGVSLRSQVELERERDKHQPGEAFTLRILRDGREMNVDARFKECSEEEKNRNRMAVLMPKAYNYVYKAERDPCAVFIGVYTTDRALDGRGVRISGVIENTPAQESGLQPGDVILALDGQPIHTYAELRRERDKHQPGDLFRLSISREGVNLEIDAIFKSCDKQAVIEKESVKMEQEAAPVTERTDATLQLVSLGVFPNPTFGPLNVQFEGEAVPTTVRITDVSGKTVYTRDLPQFSGQFSEQINLFGKTPGNYILSVQQGDKILTRSLVLLPRA